MPEKKFLNKKLYIGGNLETAIVLYNGRGNLNELSTMFPNIPCQKITYRIKKAKEDVAIVKPGPKPIITNKMEEDLQSCIIGMHRNGVPVSKYWIIVKGNEIYCLVYGITRSTELLG